MDGYAQTLSVTDLLSTEDSVTNLHQRGTRSADVLNHGDHNLLRLDLHEFGDTGGHFFVIFGVDASKKQAFHSFTSIMF
jgi:hypothetical protein